MFCAICQNDVDQFLTYGLPPRRGRCPQCGAKPRNRAVHRYLRQRIRPRLEPDSEVIEVGPSRLAARCHCDANVLGVSRYTAIDTRRLAFHKRMRAPHRFFRMSVTRMRFDDECFDLVLCNNVLPYVEHYRAALAEIRRCLKRDGLAMLNTSMDARATRAVLEYRAEHPELSDEYFSENGDQWVFGRDLLDRIESAGLLVRCETPFAGCAPAFLEHNGLRADHEFVLATRSAAGFERFR